MDDLPADLREFLQTQPFLELTETKRIKCTLNGHEIPCNLAELQTFVSGRKFKKLCAAEFNYSQYEPHVVPSTKQPYKSAFCKLTLRHLNRMPHHVLRHVSGKRYKKALAQYEECVKQGVPFVPARLRQKTRPRDTDGGMRSEEGGSRSKHKQKETKKRDSGIWAPSSSEGEGSDSEDSMSDLYPPTLFTLKESAEQEKMEKDEDEFQTDDDMEVSETEEEKQAAPKRKKVQSAAFIKKFKKNRKKKGVSCIIKLKNGK